MTFIAHAAIGALVYALPLRAIGAPAEACGAAGMLGAQLGALPDVLPWAIGRLTGRGDIEQWLRTFLHNPPPAAARVMWLLIAPGLHVWSDRFVHAPRLPDPGTSPWHDRVIVWGVTVRDIIWCSGEAVLWLIVLALIVLYGRI